MYEQNLVLQLSYVYVYSNSTHSRKSTRGLATRAGPKQEFNMANLTTNYLF